MRRLIAVVLILHGLAHAGAGIWASPTAPASHVNPLWWLSMVGFMGAGLGLLGFPRLSRWWLPLATVAALASLGLLSLYWSPALMIGAAIDGAILLANLPSIRAALLQRFPPSAPAKRPRLALFGRIFAGLFVAYLTTVILIRPWHMRWGVSDTELSAPLPGDEFVAQPDYRIDHGVTIHAPADSVWPWLVQIGQNRAGFYSYDWLERLIGDPVYNADRIVPEWQSLEVGDLVRATPPNYMGGVFGRELGWRVSGLAPGRAILLEGWGAFVLQPVDDSTTRLLVRTLGEGKPSIGDVALAPAGLLVFEPAHFIMERGMLLGIKRRAEASRTPAGWRA